MVSAALREQHKDIIRQYDFCMVDTEFKLDLYPHALPAKL